MGCLTDSAYVLPSPEHSFPHRERCPLPPPATLGLRAFPLTLKQPLTNGTWRADGETPLEVSVGISLSCLWWQLSRSGILNWPLALPCLAAPVIPLAVPPGIISHVHLNSCLCLGQLLGNPNQYIGCSNAFV